MSRGEGTFPRAHGLHIDANDILYCTDDGGHFVRKCTTAGKVLLEIGVPAKPVARHGGEAGPGLDTGKFVAPHGPAADARGDSYVGEVSYTEYWRLFPDRAMPWRMRSLQELQKLD